MIKPKTPKSPKVEKSKKSSKIVNSIKRYQIICKIFMIKSKITKLAKVEKTEKNTPSEPSCQPEKDQWVSWLSTQICAFECESAWSPNHITFECTRTRSACWSALSRDHFRDYFRDHFKRARITSKSHLNADLLWVWLTSHSNVRGSVWVCRQVCWRSGTTPHCLWIAFECKSAQSLICFAFKRAGICLWMQFSPGAKPLRIQTC